MLGTIASSLGSFVFDKTYVTIEFHESHRICMLTKRFQKQKEDFKCGNCGIAVAGSGYTNHCSNCLWSRHVDVMPGDRGEGCGGMMEPVGLESKSKGYSIWHRCVLCGQKRKTKASSKDNFASLKKLSSNIHSFQNEN